MILGGVYLQETGSEGLSHKLKVTQPSGNGGKGTGSSWAPVLSLLFHADASATLVLQQL